MYYLKYAFVIVICLPILYFGIVFVGKLMDSVIANIRNRKEG
jgi:hypothetical protein